MCRWTIRSCPSCWASYYEASDGGIELLDVAGDPFDLDLVRKGELTPMFFGSAITNFGVEPFLNRFL